MTKYKRIKLTAKTVDEDPAGLNVGSLEKRSNQPKYKEPKRRSPKTTAEKYSGEETLLPIFFSEGGGTSVHRLDSDVTSLLLIQRFPLRCDGISNSITN